MWNRLTVQARIMVGAALVALVGCAAFLWLFHVLGEAVTWTEIMETGMERVVALTATREALRGYEDAVDRLVGEASSEPVAGLDRQAERLRTALDHLRAVAAGDARVQGVVGAV
ncbi:MAG TPA: hypothetical protein ENK19_01695, partial [Acidobacteria bacterium]|nr:hypothetical protein [Acidobacteriota bacterium]